MGFGKQRLILRQEPGHWDYEITGDFIPGNPIAFFVSASVQPLNATDVQILPEGSSSKGMVKVYTFVQLWELREEIENVSPAQNPDKIVWMGKLYELDIDSPYQSGIIDHFKYRFKLLGVIDESTVKTEWEAGNTQWN